MCEEIHRGEIWGDSEALKEDGTNMTWLSVSVCVYVLQYITYVHFKKKSYTGGKWTVLFPCYTVRKQDLLFSSNFYVF